MNAFGVTLDEPAWLWIVSGVVPMGVIAAAMFSAMARIRLVSAVAARAGVLGIAGLMLAGAASVREVSRVAVIAVVDVSESALRHGDFGMDEAGRPIGPAAFAQRYLEQAAEERGPDDLLGVVAFDGAVRVAALPRRGDVLSRPIIGAGVEGSALADAIERAAAMLPPDATGRVVVFSDGNQTSGDAADAAARLAGRRGVAGVSVVPYAMRRDAEVVVEALDAPPNASPGSTVTLRVQFRATGPADGTLRVTVEGRPVDLNGDAPGDGRPLRLAPGRSVQLVDVPIGDDRVSRFAAVFEPRAGDSSTTNNRAESFTLASGPGRVLLVDGVGEAGDALARAIATDGVRVDRVEPGLIPDDLLSLQTFDLVVMADVAAEEVDAAAEAALEGYVRDLGGGLLFTGGPDAFGAGGWRGSRLEALMPVNLDLPEKLVVPEAAIVLVLDNSGSMAQTVMGSAQTQQAIANEAAARAIATLDKGDLVGVVAFNSTASVVHALGKNTAPDALAARVRAIGPGGGTNMAPGLRLAQAQLRAVDAKVKHVIVLTDGHSEGTDQLPDLARELRDEGVRLSAIGVGDGADTATLERMAQAGDGVAYHVVNPRVLPRVFIKAIRVVRSPMIREVPFEPVVLPVASPLTQGLATPPTLEGLVLTQARPDPDIVNAIATPQGEPVLAHWRVGLGQVGAFTSDAHRWGRRWVAWDGFVPFWSRAARTLARAREDGTGELRVERDGDHLRLRYDAFDADGTPLERLAVPVSVYGPDGQRQTLRLRQSAPGVYTAEASARASGNHIAVAAPSLDGTPLPPVVGGTTVSTGAELQRLEPDTTLLRRLAETTGGRVLDPHDPANAGLFDRAGIEPAVTRTPLWPVLLGWFMAVMLADFATRRIAWDRFVSPAWGGWGVRALDPHAEDRAVAAAARTASLRAGRPRSAGTIRALGEDDAAAVQQREASRRHKAEQDRLAALRRSYKPAGPPTPPAREEGPPGEGPSGLMAAKRRAQARIEEERRGDEA